MPIWTLWDNPDLAPSLRLSLTRHTEAPALGAATQPPWTEGSTGQRDTIILHDEIRCDKRALRVDESAGSGSTNTSPPPLPSSRRGAGRSRLQRRSSTPETARSSARTTSASSSGRGLQEGSAPALHSSTAPAQRWLLSRDQACHCHRLQASHVQTGLQTSQGAPVLLTQVSTVRSHILSSISSFLYLP